MNKRLLLTTVFAVTTLLAGALPAHAAMSLNTNYGSGDLDLNYGGTGITGIEGYFSGEFGILTAASIDSIIGLDFDFVMSGEGTDSMRLTYTLSNDASSPNTFNINFIALADPNGDGLFSEDLATTVWPATANIEEPDGWAADDFFDGNLHQRVQLQGELNDTDNCSSPCDLLFAMEWDLGTLNPGDAMAITVMLSEAGNHISDRYLVSSLDDGAGGKISPELTMSGVASAVVPVPGAGVLLISALTCLVGLGRKRHS